MRRYRAGGARSPQAGVTGVHVPIHWRLHDELKTTTNYLNM